MLSPPGNCLETLMGWLYGLGVGGVFFGIVLDFFGYLFLFCDDTLLRHFAVDTVV
jgi:hypothetical protein